MEVSGWLLVVGKECVVTVRYKPVGWVERDFAESCIEKMVFKIIKGSEITKIQVKPNILLHLQRLVRWVSLYPSIRMDD